MAEFTMNLSMFLVSNTYLQYCQQYIAEYLNIYSHMMQVNYSITLIKSQVLISTTGLSVTAACTNNTKGNC